jgi:hypothetical protein
VYRRYPLFLLFLLALPAHAQEWNYLDDEAESGGYDVTAQITGAPAELLLSKAENGDAYDLKFTSKALQLWKTKSKKPQLLAQTPLSGLKFPTNLVAQRRGARWRFLLNGLSSLEAEDDSFTKGQIGTRGGVKDARVQPIEPIQFDDDFMRVASEVAMKDALQNPRAGVKITEAQFQESIWNVVSGRFATTGLTENAEAQVAQSANPFAFRPLNVGENLALAGRNFWSDYSAAVSVEPQGATEVGLLVYAQDAKNYLGLFWNEKGPQLRAVVRGVPKVLDSAPGFGPIEQNQWVRMRLEIAGGQLRGFIDDAEVVRSRSPLFGRGQVGVTAQLPVAGDDKKGVGAVFDDADVRSITDFYDDFHKVVPGRWTTIAGNWDLTGAARAVSPGSAYAVMGESSWTGYRALGDLKIPADGAAGLLLHHTAGKGAYLLRVSGSKARGAAMGKAQIVLIQGNKTQVLGEKAIGKRFDGSGLRWSFGDENGYLSAKVGDELIVDAYDNSLKQGRAGIYGQNGATEARITDFSIEFPKVVSKWAKVPELYEVEQQAQTMGGWSTPQGFWVARPATDKATDKTTLQNAIWHKGEFFGEEDLKFALPDLSGGKALQLLFSGKANSRLTLNLSLKDGLVADLSDGKKNWSGTAKIEKGAPLEISRRGTFFIVKSGESLILAARVQ